MPSPFRKDQLSAEMVARYGMDRRPWGTWVLAGVLIVAAVVAFLVVARFNTGSSISVQVVGWDESATDHVDVDFIVNRPGGVAVECAVRAQDRTHVDVGYAVTTVPAGEDRAEQVFSLAVIAPAANAEVLGCAVPGELNVTQPDFPPGVVPPDQPYRP